MPTTSDDSAAPRRRLLGTGPAAAAPGSAVAPGVRDEAAVRDVPAVRGALPPQQPEGVRDEAEREPEGVRDASPPQEPEVVGDSAEPEAVRHAGGSAESQTEAVTGAESGPEAEVAEVEPGAGPHSDDAGPAADEGGAGPAAPAGGDTKFTVRLANFEGPFDLLLQLISKHKMDVTEVALSKVTNEFMAHLHAMGPDWDLDQTTEFLVVAATLLDLKAARLLPAAEVEDEADLALLEARDLLFARLLQYRAYKRIAAIFAERLEAEALSRPRTVGLEPQHAELLPEVVLSIGPERFAQLAVKAMQPRPRPQVYVDHIHAPLVSVREQAEHVVALLRERGAASFGELTADAADTLTVVARFLALLELYREKAVALEQPEALGALHVRWTGGDQEAGRPLVTDEFDQESGAARDKPAPDAPAPAAGEPAKDRPPADPPADPEPATVRSDPEPVPAVPHTATEPGVAGEGELR